MILMWLTIFRYRISSRNNNTQLIDSVLDPFFLDKIFPPFLSLASLRKGRKGQKKKGAMVESVRWGSAACNQ